MRTFRAFLIAAAILGLTLNTNAGNSPPDKEYISKDAAMIFFDQEGLSLYLAIVQKLAALPRTSESYGPAAELVGQELDLLAKLREQNRFGSLISGEKVSLDELGPPTLIELEPYHTKCYVPNLDDFEPAP